jgi:hypothetical protein
MSNSRTVLLIIVVGTAIRLLLAGFTGLGYDESYMVGNARLFSLSYVDHAPLHVWMTWAMEHIFASEAPIVVRLPFVLMFAGSTWLMYRLTVRLFGDRAGFWAVICSLPRMWSSVSCSTRGRCDRRPCGGSRRASLLVLQSCRNTTPHSS